MCVNFVKVSLCMEVCWSLHVTNKEQKLSDRNWWEILGGKRPAVFQECSGKWEGELVVTYVPVLLLPTKCQLVLYPHPSSPPPHESWTINSEKKTQRSSGNCTLWYCTKKKLFSNSSQTLQCWRHYEPKPRDTLSKANVFNKWPIFVLARIGETTGFFTEPLPVAVSWSDYEVTYSLRGSWFHILH